MKFAVRFSVTSNAFKRFIAIPNTFERFSATPKYYMFFIYEKFCVTETGRTDKKQKSDFDRFLMLCEKHNNTNNSKVAKT